MARQIAEPPVLFGEDAERFVKAMEQPGHITSTDYQRMEESYNWLHSMATFNF